MPGHKGFAWQEDGSFTIDNTLKNDLTELPGLDELAYPSGVIENLEKRAAAIWGAKSTFLSTNGATAGILASILMLSTRGTHLLVPRNCHRSVVHGLILSGLEPIWFDPIWQPEWDLWGPPDFENINSAIKNFKLNHSDNSKIAGLIITSPTYAGALANIASIAKLCDQYNFPLVVDEAHGAHLPWTNNYQSAALQNGAALVIHSLHKTLSCPTQTGLLHMSNKAEKDFGISESELRSFMTLVQSSSPSYLFMDNMDKLITAFENNKAQAKIKDIDELAIKLKGFLSISTQFELYEFAFPSASSHILIRHKNCPSDILQEFLIESGIFPEALPGNGLLLLLGIGSQASDIEKLKLALQDICSDKFTTRTEDVLPLQAKQVSPKPRSIEQAIGPRIAFFAPSHMIPSREAIGKISAECLAPCPPGWPILVPGQRISQNLLNFKNIKSVRVLKN